MTIATTYGPWKLTYGPGVELEHIPTNATIYFQPGDDSDTFLDRFTAMQEQAPQRPIAAILATLWSDYY